DAWPTLASGLLMLPLANEKGACCWFRVEEPEEVRWAGNPHEPAVYTQGKPLTPRRSFATWVDRVRKRSRAWSAHELDAAQYLGQAFDEVQRNLRILRLNRELEEALDERDVLLRQKIS